MSHNTEYTSMADPAKLAYCGRKPGTKPGDKPLVYPEWLLVASAPLGGLHSGKEPIAKGVLITQDATDTDWYHKLAKTANGLCCVKGRIKLSGASPTRGSSLFYYGDDYAGFEAAFIERGWICPLPPVWENDDATP